MTKVLVEQPLLRLGLLKSKEGPGFLKLPGLLLGIFLGAALPALRKLWPSPLFYLDQPNLSQRSRKQVTDQNIFVDGKGYKRSRVFTIVSLEFSLHWKLKLLTLFVFVTVMQNTFIEVFIYYRLCIPLGPIIEEQLTHNLVLVFRCYIY